MGTRDTLTLEFPDWVKAITNESLRTDVEYAIVSRRYALNDDADATPAGRKLITQGDRLLNAIANGKPCRDPSDRAWKAQCRYRDAMHLAWRRATRAASVPDPGISPDRIRWVIEKAKRDSRRRGR